MKNNELYQLYWCIHHEGTPVNEICIPLEFNYEPIQNRIDYIKANKPANEIPIRLNALRLVVGELPIEVIEAIKAYREAYKAYNEAYKAYDEAIKAYIEANKAYREAYKACDEAHKAYGEAHKAYREACKACDEANKACDEANKACDEANKAYREALKACDEDYKSYDEACKAYGEAILKNEDKIMELFHQECPDVNWDMEKGLVFGP